MPTVWRQTTPAFARRLDGEGSREAGGRWNSPGRGLVYTSSHLSLCVLEVYVHLPSELRDQRAEFEAVRISVPDDMNRTEMTIKQFERLMASADPLRACRDAGDRWLAAAAELVLAAPSVVVPEELNMMLNPAHPRMREVTIVSTRRFRLDPRLVVSA